jgi:hypothetical protein
LRRFDHSSFYARKYYYTIPLAQGPSASGRQVSRCTSLSNLRFPCPLHSARGQFGCVDHNYGRPRGRNSRHDAASVEERRDRRSLAGPLNAGYGKTQGHETVDLLNKRYRLGKTYHCATSSTTLSALHHGTRVCIRDWRSFQHGRSLGDQTTTRFHEVVDHSTMFVSVVAFRGIHCPRPQ